MIKRYFLTAFLSLLIASCSAPGISGHVDETDSGIKASLVNITGTPVRNASVRVFTHMDSTGVWKDSVTTDDNGMYSVSGLEPGRYSLWAETDTSALYLESVSIKEDSLFNKTDTLKQFHSVSVPVKVQPNHDPRTVEVQIWGTPIRHNVNEEGNLVLNKVPEGVYFVRLTSTLPGYSPTNDTLFINEQKPDGNQKDSLELIYTGIPTVSGIEASIDTFSGVATINWNASPYRDLDAYLIYRDPLEALSLSYMPIGVTSGTIFQDKIPDDMKSQKFVYRVKIRANSEGKEGPVFHKDTIDYVNPAEHLSLIKKESDIVNLHHKYEVSYSTPAWIGDVKSVDWSVPGTEFSGKGEAGKFSFTLADHLGDTLVCRMTMTGTNGRELTDSITLYVQSQIVQIEGKGGVPGSLSNPIVHNNSAYVLTNTSYGDKIFEIWKAEDGVTWKYLSTFEHQFEGTISNIGVYNGFLWLITGENKLYKSLDGVDWQYESTILDVTPEDIPNNSNFLIGYEGKLFIFSEISIPNEYSSKRTIIEYTTEASIIPLAYGNDTPVDVLSTFGNHFNPFIFDGELYSNASNGSAGMSIYRYEIGSSVKIHPTSQAWETGYIQIPVKTSYNNGLIIRTSNNSYDFFPGKSLIDGKAGDYPGHPLRIDYEDKECFVYDGKLIMLGNSEVFTDAPQY